MNWSVTRMACTIIFIGATWGPVSGQNYYLVVGAFATENDDIREITSYLPGTSSDTSYSVKANEKLLHFYVLKTTNKEFVLAKSLKLQQEIEKTGAPLAEPGSALPETSHPSGELIEPSTLTASADSSGERMTPGTQAPLPRPAGQYFKFMITRPDGTTFPGKVHHVDFARERELRAFDTDTYIDVLKPRQAEPMAIVCGIFGYKEIEKYIDYADPSRTEGAYLDEHGAWVFPYPLERLEKGDVSIMYNVSFYEDAVMMRPGSGNELDELVSMMVDNPDYVIRVHAHCNGKKARTIATMGAIKNYFGAQGTREEHASARKLTRLRAEAVRSYLFDHGVDESRVRIYGWGGAGMLVDENSPGARLNDRIEIEILRD